jgi:hypothetical protein
MLCALAYAAYTSMNHATNLMKREAESSLLKNDASPASLFSGAVTYVKSDLSVHSEIS